MTEQPAKRASPGQADSVSLPAVERISIEGFKSIRALERLRLGPTNVLIGANCSGKSNFLEVFELFQALGEGRLGRHVLLSGGADKLLHLGSKQTPRMKLSIGFEGEANGFETSLQTSDADTLIPVEQPPVPSSVKDHLASWRVYHFHDTGPSSPLKRVAYVHDNRFLRRDGANLAAYLYFLRKVWPESYERIRQAVTRVATSFDDFVLHPLQLNDSKIRRWGR